MKRNRKIYLKARRAFFKAFNHHKLHSALKLLEYTRSLAKSFVVKDNVSDLALNIKLSDYAYSFNSLVNLRCKLGLANRADVDRYPCTLYDCKI